MKQKKQIIVQKKLIQKWAKKIKKKMFKIQYFQELVHQKKKKKLLFKNKYQKKDFVKSVILFNLLDQNIVINVVYV